MKRVVGLFLLLFGLITQYNNQYILANQWIARVSWLNDYSRCIPLLDLYFSHKHLHPINFKHANISQLADFVRI